MGLDFEEKTLKSEIVFDGKFIHIRRHEVLFPDGKNGVREIVEHPGAATCVVLNAKNQVLMVEQFRKAAESVLLEIPAGKLDPNESPEACVKREVAEETGVIIGKPKFLCWFYPTPGFANEKMYLYLASVERQGEAHQMEDELIHSRFVPFEEALTFIKTGKIVDAKTIIGLMLTKDEIPRASGSE